MIKIRQNDAEKVAFGVAGLAGGTLAMKAIEKAIASPTVSGMLGFEGVATLQEIAPSLAVGIIGTGFFAKNRSKSMGYAGLGAAMAAGARVVEKVSSKTIFSGLGDSSPNYYLNDNQLPAIAGDDNYYYDDMDGYSIEDDEMEGTVYDADDDIL